MLHCCAFMLTSSPYRLMARAYNPSRPQDRPFVYSCIPAPNLMQLPAANDGVKLACPFCIRSRTSRINNPEGDVYEVRDRFEGGCSGSRGRACRLSGSEAPPS